ncbi:carboxylesterase/lipase family protein [Nocardia callitridis]|uniref:Carboxylic ester hydrolase n=1 Tax=Nocardia callitridis TaxID=648753 RepID=A0ABP9JV96_9NOCA
MHDATEFGLAAVQRRQGARTGARSYQPTGEDALTLNVTAPVAPASALRPVLVFIHGGGYLFGTSSLSLYSGAGLAAYGDVIVVSMNYRLGGFGYVDFGEFGTAEQPFESNLGLRDQVAALEWVRANIAAFGGDPGNVTIFGESAGANAVLTLLATPAAKGLFHQAISQSAPADWSLTADDARAFAHRCVERLGATPDTAAAVLRTAPGKEIGRAVDRAVGAVLREHPGRFTAVPVVDGDYLPRAPLEAIIDGTAHSVPLIIGTNRDEGTLFSRFEDSLPTTADRLRKALARSGENLESRVAAAYPGYPEAKAAVRAGGDYVFWRSSLLAMEGHSRHAPTYAYRYDFAPRALRLAGFGATHASDLIPVFGAADSPFGRVVTAIGGRGGLRAVQSQFQDNWLAFARTGSPLASWTRYTETRRSTLIIDAPTRLEDDPDRAKRLAWQGVRVASLT